MQWHAGRVVPEFFKDDNESQWESMENWEISPPVPKTPELMATKFCAGDNFADTYPYAKLHYDLMRGFSPAPHPLPTAPARTKWLGWFFGFWRRHTEKPHAPIFTIYTSNDVVSRKNVSFGIAKIKCHIPTTFPQNANCWPIFDRTENFASIMA